MTPGFRAFLVVVAVLVAIALTACANGVEMTQEEVKTCRDAGCTAWTEPELRALIQRAGMAGYYQGWRDANRQAGRGI